MVESSGKGTAEEDQAAVTGDAAEDAGNAAEVAGEAAEDAEEVVLAALPADTAQLNLTRSVSSLCSSVSFCRSSRFCIMWCRTATTIAVALGVRLKIPLNQMVSKLLQAVFDFECVLSFYKFLKLTVA